MPRKINQPKTEVSMAEVIGLYCYPIKSCGQVELQTSQISSMGLAHDRQWMLVDEEGLFLSQRKHPRMGLIAIEIKPDDSLLLNAPDMPELTIAQGQTTDQTTVTVWKDTLQADVAESHINKWFSEYLDLSCRLVRYGSQSQRLVDPEFKSKHIENEQTVAFADGFPILITHQATLELLNKQLAEQNHPAVTMQRFRPNIVVKGDLVAHDEYQWKQVSTNDLTFDPVKPCSRCVMTNLDPKTAKKTGNTVLKTLAKNHLINKKATFGINAICQNNGLIRIGDRLQISNQK